MLSGAVELQSNIQQRKNNWLFVLQYPQQGFWYFARSRTREIRGFPRNFQKNMKYREICQKYFQIHVDKTDFLLILAIRPILFTQNVQIDLEASSLQRVNNVPKLTGIFRSTLRKTGH